MRAGSWPSIALIYIFSVIAGGSLGKLIPLVPDMALAMHCSPESAAWFISSIAAASVLLAPLGGTLADRLGDRRLIVMGLLAGILGNAGGILAGSYSALLGARLIEGAGFIALSLGATTMMLRTTSGARQATAMALMSTGVPLGVGLAEALAGLAAGAHWRNVFWAHGATLLVLLLAVVALPSSGAQPQDRSASIGWSTVVRSSGPLRLALGIGIMSMVLFGLGAIFPLFLMQVHGLSAPHAAAYGTISYPASIIGSLAIGGILARVSTARPVILYSLAVMAVTGTMTFLPGLGTNPSAGLLFLFYVTGGMIGAIGMARLAYVVSDMSAMGVTGGLFLQCSNLGILIGAPITFSSYVTAGATGVALLTIGCTAITAWLWGMESRIAGATAHTA